MEVVFSYFWICLWYECFPEYVNIAFFLFQELLHQLKGRAAVKKPALVAQDESVASLISGNKSNTSNDTSNSGNSSRRERSSSMSNNPGFGSVTRKSKRVRRTTAGRDPFPNKEKADENSFG